MDVTLELREGYKDPNNKGLLTGVHVSPERNTRVNKEALAIKLLVSSIFMRHLRLFKFCSVEQDGGEGNSTPLPSSCTTVLRLGYLIVNRPDFPTSLSSPPYL